MAHVFFIKHVLDVGRKIDVLVDFVVQTGNQEPGLVIGGRNGDIRTDVLVTEIGEVVVAGENFTFLVQLDRAENADDAGAFAVLFSCWIGPKPGPGKGFKDDLLGK